MQLSVGLDEFDRKILQVLERDGRVSNVALADKVGLSPSASLRRVQALERNGYITGYRAVLDRSKMGGAMTLFVMVGLSAHQTKDAQAFEQVMATAPEVRECHNITGTVEYLLRIEVANLEAYKTFHSQTLGTLPQVSSITSHLCLGSSKDMRA